MQIPDSIYNPSRRRKSEDLISWEGGGSGCTGSIHPTYL